MHERWAFAGDEEFYQEQVKNDAYTVADSRIKLCLELKERG